MKKSLILIIVFLLPVMGYAQEAYVRLSVGYNNVFGVGLGRTFSDKLFVGGEMVSWSDGCGLVGGVDCRYYFTKRAVRPFVDVMAGYGRLGETMEYRDYYDFVSRGMLGLNWKWLGLGVGLTHDPFYGAAYVVSLSCDIVPKKKK